jgi:hypothetical protein
MCGCSHCGANHLSTLSLSLSFFWYYHHSPQFSWKGFINVLWGLTIPTKGSFGSHDFPPVSQPYPWGEKPQVNRTPDCRSVSLDIHQMGISWPNPRNFHGGIIHDSRHRGGNPISHANATSFASRAPSPPSSSSREHMSLVPSLPHVDQMVPGIFPYYEGMPWAKG